MMGALIRALTNNAVENIEEALGMTDATSSAMKHAIAEWYAAWYGRVPTKTEDPCQRLPYAIVNKLCKATFGEYDSGLQHTDSAKGKYLDCVRSAFDACKTSFMTQAMIGGEAWAKPVPMPDGRLTWQIVGRDSIIILGRDASGIPSDVALCEKSVSADQEWTERKELVQMGLLKPELALAWKFDLPAETEADLAEIRKNYMPELKDLEG